MNFLVVNKILDKMLNDTRINDISLDVILLKKGIIIDKKGQ